MVVNAKGTIKGGMIVPEQEIKLPEGSRVTFSVEVEADGGKPTLGDAVAKFAGTVKGYPADLSRNHDHYLYGTPKHD